MSTTQTEQTPQTPSGGAPRGNRNRMRHGLTAAKLPAGCGYISNRVGQFRKQLETEVIATHAEIGIYHSALVQSACRHETRAKLLSRWLREGTDEIKTTTSKAGTNGDATTPQTTEVRRTTLGLLEKAQLLREISNASDSRDKCLEKLRLDKATDTPWPLFPPLPEPIASAPPGGADTAEDVGSHADGVESDVGDVSGPLTEESGQ